MKRRKLLVGASALGLVVARPFVQAELVPLRIGLTSVILADQNAFLARWAAYLAERLGRAVSFAIRDEYQAIHDLLVSGSIDAAWTCGYPYVRFESQLRLLAVPLYKGQPLYQAYLIRPRTVGNGKVAVRDWSDLRGKILAYSDPLSNSGWLVAQAQLARSGISNRDLARAFFAHGHRNVAESVASRLAHAGSIDGYVWETMTLREMGAAQQTEVVWKSDFHAFPPIVTGSNTPKSRTAALQKVLLAMGGDSTGRLLLGALNLDGFSVGTPALFDSIRNLAASVPGSGVAA